VTEHQPMVRLIEAPHGIKERTAAYVGDDRNLADEQIPQSNPFASTNRPCGQAAACRTRQRPSALSSICPLRAGRRCMHSLYSARRPLTGRCTGVYASACGVLSVGLSATIPRPCRVNLYGKVGVPMMWSAVVPWEIGPIISGGILSAAMGGLGPILGRPEPVRDGHGGHAGRSVRCLAHLKRLETCVNGVVSCDETPRTGRRQGMRP
jgi:hypothetical protein